MTRNLFLVFAWPNLSFLLQPNIEYSSLNQTQQPFSFPCLIRKTLLRGHLSGPWAVQIKNSLWEPHSQHSEQGPWMKEGRLLKGIQSCFCVYLRLKSWISTYTSLRFQTMGPMTKLVFHLSRELFPFLLESPLWWRQEPMITPTTCQTLRWRCTRILKNLKRLNWNLL